MSAVGDSNAGLFELELDLPDDRLLEVSKRLIGFDARYERIRRDLQLLSGPDEIRAWSQKSYRRVLPLCDIIKDRYPLMIFAGDVGNGKTQTAEAACDRLARARSQDAMLFKLSTRVRGEGKVGQMSALISQAFEVMVKNAGKRRSAFLIIDEADSLASSRETAQSHHEDKVAVNTLIQRIDDLRRHGGRIVVILCTNRLTVLDPGIVRRAARTELFPRPNSDERRAVFAMDYDGLNLSKDLMEKLVEITGPRDNPPRVGFTFSDLRSRLLPEAVLEAFPDRPMTGDDVLLVATRLTPSPSLEG